MPDSAFDQLVTSAHRSLGADRRLLRTGAWPTARPRPGRLPHLLQATPFSASARDDALKQPAGRHPHARQPRRRRLVRTLVRSGMAFEKPPAHNPKFNIYHCFLRDQRLPDRSRPSSIRLACWRRAADKRGNRPVRYSITTVQLLRRREVHLQVLQRLDDRRRDHQVAIPLAVGRNHVPRRIVRTRARLNISPPDKTHSSQRLRSARLPC